MKLNAGIVAGLINSLEDACNGRGEWIVEDEDAPGSEVVLELVGSETNYDGDLTVNVYGPEVVKKKYKVTVTEV